MDNLIDNTYFRGIIELPFSLFISDYDTPSGERSGQEQNRLDDYIAEFQPDFLTRLFGSEIIPDGYLPLLINERVKRSVIADFVFCNVIHEYQSQATVSGEEKQSGQGSVSESYLEKHNFVWNRMVKQCLRIRQKLIDAGLNETYKVDYNDEIFGYKTFV